MSDGRRFGEGLLVLLAIVAVLLAAAFLPLVDVFGAGGAPGEFGLDGVGGNGGGGGSDLGGQLGELAAIAGSGSPLGGSLSQPPEQTGIGGGRQSNQPLKSVPLFVVDSPENTYWRQTAYTSYTGTGWEQSTTDRPISQGVPNDDRTVDGRTIEYEVTVLTATQSLPTAWQPDSVRLSNQSGTTVRASTVGGVTTDRRVPKGSTYVAESARPPRDPDVLRRANGRAPADIREPYTQLPSDTPARVEQFSRELLAGEESRYDRVMAAHDWLESNKGYSLETPIDPSQPVADQLLFEVDDAYCQQFATTMAVMLRSQNIPARYVVGFARGKAVGDGEYLVTSDRAHAWVEVYFQDVGWVRFDPTPGGALPVESPQPPYNISLNRSAVVGAPVAVSVDKNDSAVVGVPVYVNDERVGWTGAGGKVTTRLPYAEDVTVTARPAGSETKYTDGSGSTTTVADLNGPATAVTAHLDGVLSTVASSLPLPVYRVGGPVVETLRTGILQTSTNDESSVTYRSETNATISVGGDRTAGGTARVVVTVQNVPVADATVAFDGEPVGSTDAEGTYKLSLADVEPGTHSVTATREPVEASTTVSVSAPEDDSNDSDDDEQRDPLAPNISVSPSLIALPGGSATATVSRNGQPLSGTEVRVDDTVVGETDANGTVGFTFPITDSVVVAATANGVTGEQPVEGLYRNAGGVTVAVLGALGGLGVLARRYGITRRLLARKLAAVAAVLISIPHRLTELVIRLANGFAAAVGGLWRRLRSLPSLLSGSLTDVLRRLSPRGLLAGAVAWLRARFQDLRRRSEDETAASDEAVATDTAEHRRLRAIWRSFVEFVRPPKLATRTPSEIGRYAIRRGLPRQSVEYITDLYRAVEYGRRSPDDSRLESARNALSAVQDSEEDDE